MKSYHLFLCIFLFNFSITFGQDIILIPFQEDGKWGYMDNKENTIIEAQFHKVTTFTNNTAIVVDKNGKSGLINSEGLWELKPKYSNISETLNEQVFIVENNHQQIGVLHRVGKELIPMEYDSIFVFDNKNNYIVCKGEKYGIYNTDLDYWKLPLRYYEIAFDENQKIRVIEDNLMGFLEPETYAVVSKPQIVMNKTRGGSFVSAFQFTQGKQHAVVQTSSGFNLLGKNGQLVLNKSTTKKIKELDITSYNTNGYNFPSNAQYISGKKVYIDAGNNTFHEKNVSDYKLSQVDPENENIQKSETGRYFLIKDGEKVSKEYDSLFVYNEDFLQGWNYNKKKEKIDKVLINADPFDENIGKEITKGYQAMISYENSLPEQQLNWAIMISDNNKQGIFDLDTKTYIVEMDYEQIYTPYLEKYNLLLLGKTTDKFAFYDVEINKQVTEMIYSPVIDTTAVDIGYLLLQRKGGKGESEKVLDLFSVKNKNLTGRTIDGYQIDKRAPKGSLAISKNYNGWVSGIQFELSEFAPTNFQYIYYKEHGEGNVGVGFLDDQLNVIIPANYATIAFNKTKENYLKVTDFNFNEGLIDMKGKTVIEFGKYKSIGAISNGILPITNFDNQDQFIDLSTKNITIKD
ncbi:WG repeat-containing protein [Flammeovirga pacifica]|uniref:WG repeat-containing protein n=1 Tax=Flammeovirga pacifica TaxID=915059 RepID=A0A1S1Z4I7_FLAPC|nr:WG repeat-containing protein [Flammeovirga pacifica]OHX68198.1 hypothetical protein NH26_18515 [Flammeovirga pacifica]